MNYKKITAVFIGISIAIIAGYDVFVIASAGSGASISWAIISWSREHPVVSFVAGFICGHLFWSMRTPKDVGS